MKFHFHKMDTHRFIKALLVYPNSVVNKPIDIVELKIKHTENKHNKDNNHRHSDDVHTLFDRPVFIVFICVT